MTTILNNSYLLKVSTQGEGVKTTQNSVHVSRDEKQTQRALNRKSERENIQLEVFNERPQLANFAHQYQYQYQYFIFLGATLAWTSFLKLFFCDCFIITYILLSSLSIAHMTTHIGNQRLGGWMKCTNSNIYYRVPKAVLI